jgi:hypothetical protein
MRGLFAIVAISLLAACSANKKGAESPDDAEEAEEGATKGAKGSLSAGTSVCLAELAGVRYTFEDMLREQELEPAASCMTADVQVEEKGEAKAWTLRYQRVGDSDWKECKSDQETRMDFAADCIDQMRADLGGS